MGLLVALSGLSGAGKTTAVNYLKNICEGQSIYLGGLVLQEVVKRGLAPCAENERLVRLDIRRQYGPAALAILAASRVEAYLKDDINVLVDAIFVIEEYQALQACCRNSQSVLLAIDASFETRCRRLGLRVERPLSREQVRTRDETEITILGTMAVIANADYTITNESSIQAFLAGVDSFWRSTARVGSCGN
jgi:dephospho-CoA kinase